MLDLAGDIIDSNPNSGASSDNGGEEDGNSKRNKPIVAMTVRPLESPSRNKDKDYKDKK